MADVRVRQWFETHAETYGLPSNPMDLYGSEGSRHEAFANATAVLTELGDPGPTIDPPGWGDAVRRWPFLDPRSEQDAFSVGLKPCPEAGQPWGVQQTMCFPGPGQVSFRPAP